MKTHTPTTTGVYQIRNEVTGDLYVGSTTRGFNIRWAQHRSALSQGKGSRHLNGAWFKYGPDKFSFSVLMECSAADVLIHEQRYMNRLKPRYNQAPTAGNTSGFPCSSETADKIRNALTGRVSTVTRRGVIDGIDATYIEHCLRIGVATPIQVQARMARGWDMERALKTPKVLQGSWAKTDEGRAAISARMAGKKANITPEKLAARNAKIATANSLRVITDQHRANASAAHLARGKGKKYDVCGENLTAHEVSMKYPVSRHTFTKRVQAGWSPSDAATMKVRTHNG